MMVGYVCGNCLDSDGVVFRERVIPVIQETADSELSHAKKVVLVLEPYPGESNAHLSARQ